MIPPVANRFVAGESTPEAIDHVVELNDRGVVGILNLLGEHYTDRQAVVSDVEVYLDLVGDIDRGNLAACISIKPTQMGLDIEASLFREQLTRIVDTAAARDVFVWIDMEDAETTDATLEAFEELTDRHPGQVGVCVQSNLRRTTADIERLAGRPGRIRLVKGAYREPIEVAYRDPERVNEAYRSHLTTLFREHDAGIAVASHDPAMIAFAEQLHTIHGGDLEFQLLMGVRPDTRDRLATEYPVYEYIPFGPRWRSYFFRRLLERSENVKFAIRAILG